MRVAALDLGSNTFLLLIANVSPQGVVEKILCDEVRVTRLAEGVNQTKKLSTQALDRAEKCFQEYSKIIDKYQVEKTQAVATSAARDASNSEKFFELAKKYNIPVEIIAGDKEAELTFHGAVGGSPEQGTVVIDIGGGSTEIIGISNNKVKGFSLNIGSVRLTEMFISNHPTPTSELNELQSYVKNQLEHNKVHLPSNANKIIAVAGTPTTLAALDLQQGFSAKDIEGYSLSKDKLESWLNRLSQLSLEERLLLKGMERGREDVIIAGLSILKITTEFFCADSITVSTKGVRYGLASKLGSGQ